MAFQINDNFTNFFITNQLRKTQEGINASLEKFSSGKRINSAADDASGMAIADSLTSQIRGIGQAVRNATDTIAMARIADGALEQSGDLIADIRVKAIQANSGAQTAETRQALQADIDRSLEQLNNIAETTSYNGQKLLSGVFSDQSFQVGPNADETVNLTIGSAEAEQLGNNEVGQLSDINVMSEDGAAAAVEITDAALSQLNEVRSSIGSFENQLTSTINNLATSNINLASARSSIEDVDMVEEIVNFNRMQMLEQVGVFAATQATNINKQSVFNLLQG